jgi:hypothetical protein
MLTYHLKAATGYSLRNVVGDNSPDFGHSVKASMKLVNLQQCNQSSWRCGLSKNIITTFQKMKNHKIVADAYGSWPASCT